MNALEWDVCQDPQRMLAWLMQPDIHDRGPDASDRKLRLFVCACVRRDPVFLMHAQCRLALDVAERHADGQTEPKECGEAFNKAMTISESILRLPALACLRQAAGSGAQDILQAYLNGSNMRPAQADLAREVFGNPFRPVVVWRQNPEWDLWNAGGGYGRVDMEEPQQFQVPSWLTPQVITLAEVTYRERPGRECVECVDGDVGCPDCEGVGYYYDPPYSLNRLKCPKCDEGLLPNKCSNCHGTGRMEDGALDSVRLAVLADALEEAGCTDEPLLQHLRGREPAICSRCEGDGQAHGADRPFQWSPDPLYMKCPICKGSGMAGVRSKRAPCVRGCHVVDCLIGKE